MKTTTHLWSYLAQFFLEWEMFLTKIVEKIKINILCEITLKKSRRLWDNVEKYRIAGQATDGNTAHAHCMLDNYGYKHTIRICNAYGFSSATMVTWTRLSITRYTYIACFEFSVGQEPNSGLGHLNVGVSRSQTIRHTHTVGFLRTSDQPTTGAATYTSPNKHKRRTLMPSAGFEPAIAGAYRLQTYDLDGTTTDTHYDNKMTSDAFRDAVYRLHESFLRLHNVTHFHRKKSST
jgi:hypothetical protein